MAGAADGSIIATIISHHISTSAPNGGACNAALPPARITEPSAMDHQPSSASSATPHRTIARSWRRIRLVRSGADDTARGQVQVRELPITVPEIDLHRAGRSARRAADVSDAIFEPVRKHDLRPR